MVLGAGLPALLVPVHFVELQARAVALRAPAVLGVEGEKARVGLGEARTAGRAGALGREHGHGKIHLDSFGARARGRGFEPVEAREHLHHALPVLERERQCAAQLGLVSGADAQVGDGQFDAVLLEARQPRPPVGREELAVHPEKTVALPARPLGEIGVIALSVDDERGEEADAIAPVIAQEPRGDRFLALRLDRDRAVRAVLNAELHIEQAQEVVDLGERRHGALSAAAAGALLDRDGGRDAEDRVHVRPRRALDELARVGVERLEIAPLAFGEENVEGERRFSRARDPGHDGESIARNRDADVL